MCVCVWGGGGGGGVGICGGGGGGGVCVCVGGGVYELKVGYKRSSTLDMGKMRIFIA